MECLRPFLRWAGSKRQLLPIISQYWSDSHARYIEPFVGSGSLFFYLQPASAILGDINFSLIEVYEQVKNNLDALLCELQQMRKGKEEYYRVRSIDTTKLSPSQRAARFIYLNRFAFNGLYRTNRNGEFNVPYGGEKSGNIPERTVFLACSKLLQNAICMAGDFEQILDQAGAGDFVYLDPPYSVRDWRVFNEYDSSIFGPEHIKKLRNWLDVLTSRGAQFVLSYAKCIEAVTLMNGYTTTEVIVRRNIAGFASNRKKAVELLISNTKASPTQATGKIHVEN